MNEVYYVTISQAQADQRLDNYLLRILKGVPKSHIYRIIRSGEIRVNKKRAKPKMRLQADDVIRIPPVRVSAEKTHHIGSGLSACLQQSILFEDERLLVINKPTGIAVHAGSGLSVGVIEGLRAVRSDLVYLELAHRIDKATSGCLVLVKDRGTLRALQALFVEKTINKTYWALLTNAWHDKKTVVVDAKLRKNIVKSGERMVCVDAMGKASQTTFHLLKNAAQACWVEARPTTGRTHQIRVHSAHLGHPILGDSKYGVIAGIPEIKKRLYLHARSIQFNLDGHDFSFEAEPDASFLQALDLLQLRE